MQTCRWFPSLCTCRSVRCFNVQRHCAYRARCNTYSAHHMPCAWHRWRHQSTCDGLALQMDISHAADSKCRSGPPPRSLLPARRPQARCHHSQGFGAIACTSPEQQAVGLCWHCVPSLHWRMLDDGLCSCTTLLLASISASMAAATVVHARSLTVADCSASVGTIGITCSGRSVGVSTWGCKRSCNLLWQSLQRWTISTSPEVNLKCIQIKHSVIPRPHTCTGQQACMASCLIGICLPNGQQVCDQQCALKC
jgi:hypothetical protein